MSSYIPSMCTEAIQNRKKGLGQDNYSFVFRNVEQKQFSCGKTIIIIFGLSNATLEISRTTENQIALFGK